MEDSIETAFQNETSNVEYFVDTELEDNLRDLQNESDDEIDIILSTHDNDDDEDEDNRTNSNDEEEFVDDEETSPEKEFHDVDSD